MKSIDIILVGGGGHAKACADVIETNKNYKIIGYTDINKKESMIPYKYLGNDDVLIKYSKNCSFIITVGQIKSYSKRKDLFELLTDLNAKIISVKSNNSYLSPKSTVEAGTIIMHGSIIQANVKIGKNCIINDNSLIEHDSVIGDHCHISTASIINGNVKVGNGVFIGSGAIIKNGVTIADNCIIGMGVKLKYDLLKEGQIVK